MGPRRHRTRHDGSPRQSGFYHFQDGRTSWYPDVGTGLHTSSHITGNSSHRAILLRSVGPQRFAEIMAILDPERREAEAQRAALQTPIPIQTVNEAIRPELTELDFRIERLSESLKAVPIDQAIPTGLLFQVQDLLRDVGLSAGSIDEYLELNPETFRPLLGTKKLNLFTARVKVISGNVPLWFDGDESQVIEFQLFRLREKNPELASRIPRLILYHDDLFSFLRELFGSQRVYFEDWMSLKRGRTTAWLPLAAKSRSIQHSTGNITLWEYQVDRKSGRVDIEGSQEAAQWLAPSWFVAPSSTPRIEDLISEYLSEDEG